MKKSFPADIPWFPFPTVQDQLIFPHWIQTRSMGSKTKPNMLLNDWYNNNPLTVYYKKINMQPTALMIACKEPMYEKECIYLLPTEKGLEKK